MKRFAEKLDIFLWILSVPLIPMIIVEFTMDLSPAVNMAFKSYYLVLWFIFTVEFAINFFIAEDRVGYLRTHVLDLLVIVTPALRVFKVFRVLRFPIVLLSDRVMYKIGKLGLNFVYYAIFVFMVTLIGADLVFYFERQNSVSEIHTYVDAVWWSLNYITTTGSDRYIATIGGKAVGLVLMTVGFGIFSVLIASLVSFFMREYARTSPNEDLLEGIGNQLGIDEIRQQLERIEKKLDEK